MQLYQAPLEGISGYIFRNALCQVFGGVDKYFAPFISPYEKRIITDREKRQLCPENNQGIDLVPQILTMDVEGFLELTDWLNVNYGYEEFNLNFGCPSGTVVSKGRGAGALRDTEVLEDFLDRITDGFKYKLSIKTRLGMKDIEEFDRLLEIYNKYELTELIVHPRVRDELYKGIPHRDFYSQIEEKSSNLLVYNGNIFKADDEMLRRFDNIDIATDASNDMEAAIGKMEAIAKTNSTAKTKAVMIGRGMLCNPALFREIKGGQPMSGDELGQFFQMIMEGYVADFSGEVPVLHKMKEIWSYMGDYLVENADIDEKLIKKLKKSKSLSEYKIYEKSVLRCI